MTDTLRIGQSADPDDAFMAWALEQRLADSGITAELEFADIETLNRRSLDGELHLSAISVAAYPRLADRYRMLRCGASFGENYGPTVVGREAAEEPGPAAVRGLRVAIPGRMTTAYLLLRIYSGDDVEAVELPFDRILEAVETGDVDGGLIIHEGQLVYERMGLHALFEPARTWTDREGLPLPLGAVVVSRDLPEALQRRLADDFLWSIRRAFEAPEEAMEFAGRYARGLDADSLREYVHRYVDAATLDMGAAGERALIRLFALAAEAGLIDETPPLDLL